MQGYSGRFWECNENLNTYERHVPENSKHVLGGVFDTVSKNITSLATSSNERTKSLRKLLLAIRNIPTVNTEYDVLGYVYEYLISQFSAEAGKKGGRSVYCNFKDYMPQCVEVRLR